MMSADLVRFVTRTGFGLLLLTHHRPLWAMLAVQAIGGAATAFNGPAMLGLTAAALLSMLAPGVRNLTRRPAVVDESIMDTVTA